MLKGLFASSGLRGLIGSANRSSSVSPPLTGATALEPLSITAPSDASPPDVASPRPAPPVSGVKTVIFLSACFFVLTAAV